jgi:erythronate-4-phosphate dehydrogenase
MILVVRSVTRVDASLLSGSSVRFVATATAGFDHVDRPWLRHHGIRFVSTPGANAESVGDWVVAALLRLSVRRRRALAGLTAGVVGCGQVGGRLVSRLEALGMQVLTNDPPKARRVGSRRVYVSLDEVIERCDVLTLHVPLLSTGPFKTRSLVDGRLLDRLRPDAWLLNSSRGPVVDEEALLERLRAGRGPSALALDVWRNEPRPDPEIVGRADLATAHIAGYALDSKYNATHRVVRAVSGFLGQQPGISASLPAVPAIPLSAWAPPAPGEPGIEPALDRLARAVYDIERDDRNLRDAIGAPSPSAFEALRTGYPVRRLFARYRVQWPGGSPDFERAVRYSLRMRPKK